MRPPRFWQTPQGSPALAARLLAPLAWVTAAATARRVAKPAALHAGIPVICVGNINAGGTGKTPTVIALVQLLIERGLDVHVVSRGYGGSLPGPVQVDPRRHTADETGDEPLLIAAFTAAWIARDRAAGVAAAQKAGAQVVVLDDGMQNPSVHKNLTLVTVDAVAGFGNGRCLPAGPLREPVASGMARADLVLSIGPKPAQIRFTRNWGDAITVPHMTGRLEPLQTGMDWQGLPTLAFAGIGHPEKFFATLRSLGADLKRAESLSDHQPLTAALMTRLEADAKSQGAQLVTTEKDAVRLPPEFRSKVLVVPVRLQIANLVPLTSALDKILP